MKETAEVVIIGAGIQGTSVAYHLARKGMTDVIVVEMNTIGSGSSGRSAAMIVRNVSRSTRLALTRISWEAYQCFGEELGVEPGYEPIGYLGLVTHRQAQAHEVQRDVDFPSRVLDPKEIDELLPGLYLEDVAFGLYKPESGLVDPHSIYTAYATAARRLGVRIYEGVEATGLKIQNGRVSGVEPTAGVIATPRLVNAAGFRSRQVGAWAGLDLPIINLKRHIFFVTALVPPFTGPIPFVHDLEADWYFRREGPGLIMGMGKSPSNEEDPKVAWPFLQEVVEYALYRAPSLAEARVMRDRSWAGLRPVTPDEDPILGEAPSLPGFFNCCGWGGHGVMHAPAGGLLTAELIVDGKVTSGDIIPFLVDRFTGG